MVTANILIVEFKKFMFLCGLVIKTEPLKYAYYENGQAYYKAPFPAPPLIEKVWDTLILYNDNYA